MLKALDPRSLAWNGLALPVTRPGALASPILDAMAVRWVISDDAELLSKPESGMDPDRWSLEHEGGLMIYGRNPIPAPRFYLTGEAVVVSDAEEALEVLTESGGIVSPTGELRVIVEAPEGFADEETASIGLNPDSNRIILNKERPQRLEFEIDRSQAGWLVLSDAWHPEWKAWVDGQEAKIYPANVGFRAVRIPEGEHIVLFQYEPIAFIRGAAISIVTLAILLLGVVIELMIVGPSARRIRHAGRALGDLGA